ncbi:MAG: SDR family NAD(P)-dependent oxidoreductase, partial [Burkholderiales bacterium]|nr:SDR family NAD(P)-dependent oxidoreductase [Burkholderiales bacterium]
MRRNRIDLSGRSAVVTGAARGIGFSIAQRLMDSGAHVALWDVDKPALDTARKTLSVLGTVLAVPVDITDQQSVAEGADQTRAALGPVDLLVNNAGIGGP